MLKKIGFIAAGLCGTVGLLSLIGTVSNIIFLSSDTLSANLLWVIQNFVASLTWIMLAVFVGMLAYKLK